MNTLVLIAGIIASASALGHITIGSKLYLKSMLRAQFPPIPKYVMFSIFHYISAFQILSALTLIIIGAQGDSCAYDTKLVLAFIASNYTCNIIIIFVSIIKSRMTGAWLLMFQWMFWVTISALIILGIR